MARYLGIDYGEKRIGIALSDEENNFAFPKEVIAVKNEAQVIADVAAIVAQGKVDTIIVGLPLGFSMQETGSTKKARDFGEFLKQKLGIEVIFENEVLTTKKAEKSGGVSKEMIDAASAAVLLQSFLDAHRQK